MTAPTPTSNSLDTPLLDAIRTPADMRALPVAKLDALASELRAHLLHHVSQTGGHLSSNLGVVELTIALHYCFDTPATPLVWDVGHQAYIHKMLTGRANQMHTLRKLGGLAPFTKREESEYDAFIAGHAGTSVSGALGMAMATGKQAVAIIGDGGLTAGMAFEAMNHAGDVKAPLVIVLNDNGMSISENVGYLNQNAKHVKHLCDATGFDYVADVGGHNLTDLLNTFNKIKQYQTPVLVHVHTQKGAGYERAQQHPIQYHGVGAFDIEHGVGASNSDLTFSKLFGLWATYTANTHNELRVITPAMTQGSGLDGFARSHPKQCIDVGIAEQHSVTLGAGMATQGLKPVVAIYSTFLQRAYDQLIHDVALQDLPVIFAIDRAGLVGADGATHHGVFDLAMLCAVPNMTVMTPSNAQECWYMFNTAWQMNTPVAIRYPKGVCPKSNAFVVDEKTLPIGKGHVVRKGQKVAILVFGTLLEQCENIAQELDATLVDMRFAKPLDTALIDELAQTHEQFICVEEHIIKNGVGQQISAYVSEQGYAINVRCLGMPDTFIEHGSRSDLLNSTSLNQVKLEDGIKGALS